LPFWGLRRTDLAYAAALHSKKQFMILNGRLFWYNTIE
jgi:hypothetical protein